MKACMIFVSILSHWLEHPQTLYFGETKVIKDEAINGDDKVLNCGGVFGSCSLP